MKTLKMKIMAGLLLVSVLVVGCSFKSTLRKDDFRSLEPLKAASWGKEFTWVRSMVARNAVGIPLRIISPIAGVVHDTVTYYKEKDLAIKVTSLKPGLMESVVQKFVERAPKEIADWPPMAIEEGIDKAYLKNLKNSLIAFNVTGYLQTGNTNYICRAKVWVYDKEGKVVWAKEIAYDSSKNGRPSHQFEDLAANDFALLKEEVDYATDVIVSQVIDSLKK
jgi:hypothetical protein